MGLILTSTDIEMKPRKGESRKGEALKPKGFRQRVRAADRAPEPSDTEDRPPSDKPACKPSLGSILMARRKELGWSQEKAATQLGLTFSYLSRLERDEFGEPSAENLARIAETYAIDPVALFKAAGYKALARLPNCGRSYVVPRDFFESVDLEPTEAAALRDVVREMVHALRGAKGRGR